jgi:amino acid transporter
MPYGPKASIGTAGIVAATGFSVAGWLVGAVTLLFVGIALVQLARRGRALRP